jgi:signal transduction histidine kinase
MMNGVAAGAAEARGPRLRPGFGGRLLALGRAVALFWLLLAGAVLLVLLAAPFILAALGLGQFLKYQLKHGLSFDSQDTRDVFALLLGLACCRFVLPVALLATRRLAMLTRRLSAQWCGVPIGAAYAPLPVLAGAGGRPGPRRLGYQQRMSWLLNDVSTWRDMLWLVVSVVAGWVLLLAPVMMVGFGVVAFLVPGTAAIPAMDGVSRWVAPPAFPGNTPSVLLAIGVALVALGLGTAPVALRGYGGLARLVLTPSREADLARRVEQLAQTRRETLDTGAAELRRIERDLHDGAQARLVAMGLTLDAAGRLIDTDPAAARALLYEARDASARALAELRDLVRGIHPPVLADRGLADAVRALALDSPLRVRVTGPLDGRLPAPVESAGYFAVSELLTNVAKHSGAGAAEVDLRHSSGSLRITVSDDGAGGADPSRGTGLQGVARRVAAFDGVLVVSSPAGGPTVINLEVPCGSS